jgi:hypothetical protein
LPASRILCQPEALRRIRRSILSSALWTRATGPLAPTLNAITRDPAETDPAFAARQRPFETRVATTSAEPRTYATDGVPRGPSASVPSWTPRATISPRAPATATRASAKAIAADPSIRLTVAPFVPVVALAGDENHVTAAS